MNNLDKFYLYCRYNEMIYYAYELLLKYPKYERYSLVVDIKNVIYEGLRCVIQVHKEFDLGLKVKYLHNLDANLKVLKVLIRLSFKRQYISNKNYEVWSRHLTHISNLMGGLIKQCQKQ